MEGRGDRGRIYIMRKAASSKRATVRGLSQPSPFKSTFYKNLCKAEKGKEETSLGAGETDKDTDVTGKSTNQGQGDQRPPPTPGAS